MKKLQASYKEDVNKIIQKAIQDKAIKNLSFLINLAMVTTDTMPVPEEPTTFAKVGTIPMQTLEKMARSHSQRIH